MLTSFHFSPRRAQIGSLLKVNPISRKPKCLFVWLRRDMKPASITIAVGVLLSASAFPATEARPAGHGEPGAIVFKKCMACHQVGEGAQNGIGPVLNGVVGRPAGTYPGYNYSAATKNAGLVWDEPTLARYLRAPRSLIPGTRMAFPGLTKDQEIMDVIAYLEQFSAEGKQAKVINGTTRATKARRNEN